MRGETSGDHVGQGMTTIETVTKRQIERLRTEAAQAGDSEQQRICDVALGRWSDQPAEDGERELIAHAIDVCVWVIQANEASS